MSFIALDGASAEFGVIMLLYLRNAWEDEENVDEPHTCAARGGDPRGRGVARASQGDDSRRHSRAAPLVGGMITAALLSMFVIPAAISTVIQKRR